MTPAQNAREDKGPESPCVGAQAAPAALEEAVAAERPGVWGSGGLGRWRSAVPVATCAGTRPFLLES